MWSNRIVLAIWWGSRRGADLRRYLFLYVFSNIGGSPPSLVMTRSLKYQWPLRLTSSSCSRPCSMNWGVAVGASELTPVHMTSAVADSPVTTILGFVSSMRNAPLWGGDPCAIFLYNSSMGFCP